jgi:hypothetical protein
VTRALAEDSGYDIQGVIIKTRRLVQNNEYSVGLNIQTYRLIYPINKRIYDNYCEDSVVKDSTNFSPAVDGTRT